MYSRRSCIFSEPRSSSRVFFVEDIKYISDMAGLKFPKVDTAQCLL